MIVFDSLVRVRGLAGPLRRGVRLLPALSVMLAMACSDDDGGADADRVSLSISLTGLEPLGGDFEYEGWFILEDGPVSAGRFNFEEGETTAMVEIPAAAVEGATSYVLTIEPPADEDDPGPSDTHVLAGSWDGSEAQLSISHESALNDDFGNAQGVFFLQTPTSSDEADYANGIWFITPGEPMSAGLNLPELPDGWVYEGWVAGPDGPVTTGRFTDASAADDDAGGPAAGDQGAPPFPGQDFIDPATNLVESAHMAVLSVEPEPDDSPAPFAFKPLVGPIADDGPGIVQMMNNMSEGRPSGTVSKIDN